MWGKRAEWKIEADFYWACVTGWTSLVVQTVKNLPAMWDLGSILGLGRSPGEGNGHPLHYSCLENSMCLAGYSPQVRHMHQTRGRHDWAANIFTFSFSVIGQDPGYLLCICYLSSQSFILSGHYYPHLTKDKTETKMNQIGVQDYPVAELGLEPRVSEHQSLLFWPEAILLPPEALHHLPSMEFTLLDCGHSTSRILTFQ